MIAIIGATGNVGRPLVRALAAAGNKVVAISRHAVAGAGEHRTADLAQPATLGAALRGAEAMFLMIAGAGDLLDPGAILAAATAVGVRRVVLLSSIGAKTRPLAVSHEPLRRFEAEVQRSGAAWTILRPGGFDSNAFGWVPGVRAQRTIAAPFADVGVPLVDPDDIADVAAAALRGDHAGQVYELTGPARISPREQASALAAALDTPLGFVEQTRAEAAAVWTQFMPATVVETTLDALGQPTADEQRVSPDIARVLGRAPRPFTAWAARNAAAFSLATGQPTLVNRVSPEGARGKPQDRRSPASGAIDHTRPRGDHDQSSTWRHPDYETAAPRSSSVNVRVRIDCLSRGHKDDTRQQRSRTWTDRRTR